MGIDAGGLSKEFIVSTNKEAFDPQYGLFRVSSDGSTIYPNPASKDMVPGDSNCFYVIGLLLGKAVFEGVLVESRFAHFFLKKLLGRANLVDDLNSLDRTVARSLASIKQSARQYLAELDRRQASAAGAER